MQRNNDAEIKVVQLDGVDEDGNTELHQIAQDAEKLKEFIVQNTFEKDYVTKCAVPSNKPIPNINSTNHKGITPLMLSCQRIELFPRVNASKFAQ